MVVQFIHEHLPKKLQERWPASRMVNDVMVVLIVILGWLVVDQRQANHDTIDCVRDYLVEQSQSATPRTEANTEKDEALAEAVSTFTPLIREILNNARHPEDSQTPEAQERGLKLVIQTDNALSKFQKSYADLVKARKDFPPAPAPENLCK